MNRCSLYLCGTLDGTYISRQPVGSAAAVEHPNPLKVGTMGPLVQLQRTTYISTYSCRHQLQVQASRNSQLLLFRGWLLYLKEKRCHKGPRMFEATCCIFVS
jgi:hypothetical protein